MKMKQKIKFYNIQAFTLIELAIVLIIIGLLVGGVMTGRELITRAKIQGVIKQINEYRTGYSTFRLKYGCVPGDCADPGQFGFTSAYYTFLKGNNDGLVYSFNDGSVNSEGGNLSGTEYKNALSHLYQAGLVNENYGGTLKTGKGSMMIVSFLPSFPQAGNKNYLYLARLPVNNIDLSITPGALTTTQAYLIDSKLDDGLPMGGEVRATWSFYGCRRSTSITNGPCFNEPNLRTTDSAWGFSCVNNTATPFQYDINDERPYVYVTEVYQACAIHMPL
jgi:prepilin-type N-terminal cleavage/methylation domain-containing protein